MTYLCHTVFAIAMATASFGTVAQTDAEHTQHHPEEQTKKSSAATVAKAMPQESMAAMDSKMKSMREMHEEMVAAKTPEERKALMTDHMEAMQEGMAMMTGMASMGNMKSMGMGMGMGMGADAKKGGMPMDIMAQHAMMEKRMEMMTTMMQMMMDRLPSPAVP